MVPVTSPDSASLGAFGFDLITSTAARTGTWCVIEVLEDAIFTLLTNTAPQTLNAVANAAFGSLTLAAGRRIYGRFTAITLASGSVIAYRGSQDSTVA
jgi:hypothetical protein